MCPPTEEGITSCCFCWWALDVVVNLDVDELRPRIFALKRVFCEPKYEKTARLVFWQRQSPLNMQLQSPSNWPIRVTGLTDASAAFPTNADSLPRLHASAMSQALLYCFLLSLRPATTRCCFDSRNWQRLKREVEEGTATCWCCCLATPLDDCDDFGTAGCSTASCCCWPTPDVVIRDVEQLRRQWTFFMMVVLWRAWESNMCFIWAKTASPDFPIIFSEVSFNGELLHGFFGHEVSNSDVIFLDKVSLIPSV